MKIWVWRSLLLLVVFGSACGGDDSSGGANGGSAGSAGTSGTTCADGYPKIDSACAIENEKCSSCPTGYACCDIFQCTNGAWLLAQSKFTCPDAGSDAASEAGGDDAAADGSSDSGSDSPGD